MSDTAIRIENLGKQYHIGALLKRHDSLRDTIASKFSRTSAAVSQVSRAPVPTSPSLGPSDTIWALKDVSFEVKRGEVVGVIGRNGAGKSTLLKILARITEPSEGWADMYGRVASLLEVGTGFHGELSGRENIYLSGAIMGMRKREIDRKFDEIVAFSEVEKFIDTPVKHYSSGMYVRLAFAVAAHLEPEILLVDEVLAVGDAAFQKKCLGKMEEIGEQGRTVIFISHNMPMILRLCERAILLDSGRVVADGITNQVTGYYIRSGAASLAERVWPTLQGAPGDSVARLHAVRVKNSKGELAESMDIRDPVFIEIEYWNLTSQLRATSLIHVMNAEGITLFATNDWNDRDWWNTPRVSGLVRATCKIPGNLLAEGRFFILAAVGTYNPNRIHAIERDVVSFQVIDKSEGDGARGAYAGGSWPGVMRPMLEWKVERKVPSPSEIPQVRGD